MIYGLSELLRWVFDFITFISVFLSTIMEWLLTPLVFGRFVIFGVNIFEGVSLTPIMMISVFGIGAYIGLLILRAFKHNVPVA